MVTFTEEIRMENFSFRAVGILFSLFSNLITLRMNLIYLLLTREKCHHIGNISECLIDYFTFEMMRYVILFKDPDPGIVIT